MQHAGREIGGAGEAAFLVDGEDKFEGPVRDIPAFHDGQGSGHAHAIIGAEGGAVGRQPIASADQADGVGREVVGATFVLFADHVQMALQCGHDGLFAAASGGLANDHVAGGVNRGFQAQAGAYAKNIGACRGFLAGSAGNGGESLEVFPEGIRLQVAHGSFHRLTV